VQKSVAEETRETSSPEAAQGEFFQMIHGVFTRSLEQEKFFGPGDASPHFTFEASGDAWGDGVNGPWGHDYPIPPGHYKLTTIEEFAPIDSEGSMQIYVEDLVADDIDDLIAAGKAKWTGETADRGRRILDVGGIELPVSGLAVYERAAIMYHGGGSNLRKIGEDPQAPNQRLCKTEGCPRHHNADMASLAKWLRENPNNLVIVSHIGEPKPLDI
jgi:hypothetical protein